MSNLQKTQSDAAWQPIETAPRDGTEVLVLFDCATVPIVHIAWYRGREEWESSGKYCGGWDNLDEWEGWWSYTTGSVGQEKLDDHRTPTHWMPLPPAPTQNAIGQRGAEGASAAPTGCASNGNYNERTEK